MGVWWRIEAPTSPYKPLLGAFSYLSMPGRSSSSQAILRGQLWQLKNWHKHILNRCKWSYYCYVVDSFPMTFSVPAISISCQRLRNLTTGILHTEMQDIYEDLETFTGMTSLFTHQLPGALHLIRPWLRQVVTDSRFWDDKYDPTHEGFVSVRLPDEAYKKALNR